MVSSPQRGTLGQATLTLDTGVLGRSYAWSPSKEVDSRLCDPYTSGTWCRFPVPVSSSWWHLFVCLGSIVSWDP